MGDRPAVVREFGDDVSLEEARAWIDEVLEANHPLIPRGIAVSNRLHQAGLVDRYRDVPVAMSPALYPKVAIRIEFDEPVR